MIEIKLNRQENLSGDSRIAEQGFGKVASGPTETFDPVGQLSEALVFFSEYGYVALTGCLNEAELAHLNEFFNRTQQEAPGKWGLSNNRKPHHRDQGLIYSQPLLDHTELDPYTRHPSSFAVVGELLGGQEFVRFSEFNFRETPINAGVGAMNFHHDAVREDRFVRQPYLPCDWLCAIHYLTDVEVGTPAFCVVPGSNRYATLGEARKKLNKAYQEAPIYGSAGTCILYDTATFHTRLDGDGIKGRRTWHQYYARGGWLGTKTKYVRSPSPALTDWNLIPERLAMHDDPKIRLFFSHWNTAQSEWVAYGFDDAIRNSMPRGHQ